ncbi:MAG: hypothetical protein H6Q69_2025 [Firmicutes bacterium]|nr:hypothetical protein [Bacillota bacterium]
MKIDRLLGIVIYLLNRDTVSARALAEKFEVSPRTIQRDIETLGLAGIPVSSTQGTNGGYKIVNSFKINSQFLTIEDYSFIITALKGLCSAYENSHIETTFEKLISLSPINEKSPQHIHLDFSVLREGGHIKDDLTTIETAINKEMAVEFEYTNAQNDQSQRLVEPMAVIHQWYAWYLFGFCCERQDYRMFRLSRIRNLNLTCQTFSKAHENTKELLAQKQDTRNYMKIKLLCPVDMRISLEECFPRSCITETGNKELLIEFSVPDSERGWFGTLLGYGNKITILEPERLKDMFVNHAKEILKKYC